MNVALVVFLGLESSFI